LPCASGASARSWCGRQKNRGGAEKGVGRAGKNAVDDDRIPPKLADLGISKDQSAEYQDMATVEENVILDAMAPSS
jgi:hypothetical protein